MRAGTYGYQVLLNLFHYRRVTEPALWIVGVGVFAETRLVAVDEPRVHAQNGL